MERDGENDKKRRRVCVCTSAEFVPVCSIRAVHSDSGLECVYKNCAIYDALRQKSGGKTAESNLLRRRYRHS